MISDLRASQLTNHCYYNINSPITLSVHQFDQWDIKHGYCHGKRKTKTKKEGAPSEMTDIFKDKCKKEIYPEELVMPIA